MLYWLGLNFWKKTGNIFEILVSCRATLIFLASHHWWWSLCLREMRFSTLHILRCFLNTHILLRLLGRFIIICNLRYFLRRSAIYWIPDLTLAFIINCSQLAAHILNCWLLFCDLFLQILYLCHFLLPHLQLHSLDPLFSLLLIFAEPPDNSIPLLYLLILIPQGVLVLLNLHFLLFNFLPQFQALMLCLVLELKHGLDIGPHLLLSSLSLLDISL